MSVSSWTFVGVVVVILFVLNYFGLLKIFLKTFELF